MDEAVGALDPITQNVRTPGRHYFGRLVVWKTANGKTREHDRDGNMENRTNRSEEEVMKTARRTGKLRYRTVQLP